MKAILAVLAFVPGLAAAHTGSFFSRGEGLLYCRGSIYERLLIFASGAAAYDLRGFVNIPMSCPGAAARVAAHAPVGCVGVFENATPARAFLQEYNGVYVGNGMVCEPFR